MAFATRPPRPLAFRPGPRGHLTAAADVLRRARRARHAPFISPSRFFTLRSGAARPAPPLLGFASPLRRHPSARPLPEGSRLPSAPWQPRHEVSFRPRGLAPPRRVPPCIRPWACCIPLPTLGFTAFLGLSPRLADCSTRRPGEPRPSPQCELSLRSLSSPAAGTASPRPFCPLAVALPCSLSGSARVRTPSQGSRPLAQASSPRG